MTLRDGMMVPGAVVELAPERRNIARVSTDQRRSNLTINQFNQGGIVARASGGILRLAPADKAAGRLDPQDCGIKPVDLAKIAAVLPFLGNWKLNPACLYTGDAGACLGQHQMRLPIKGSRVSAVLAARLV